MKYPIYTEQKYPETNEVIAIQRESEDGTISSIPLDESNADYQTYLRWLENPNAQQLGGNPIGDNQ